MATIIFNIAIAMAALSNGCTHIVAIEHPGLAPFDEVQHPVMAGRKPIRDWQTVSLVDCDPVLEDQFRLLLQKKAILDQPLRQIVDEECASRSQHPHRFGEPTPGPFEVIRLRPIIAAFAPVLFVQVKRGIGEKSVDRSGLKRTKEIEAVRLIDSTKIRMENFAHRRITFTTW